MALPLADTAMPISTTSFRFVYSGMSALGTGHARILVLAKWGTEGDVVDIRVWRHGGDRGGVAMAITVCSV